jgi:hypothetical protein
VRGSADLGENSLTGGLTKRGWRLAGGPHRCRGLVGSDRERERERERERVKAGRVDLMDRAKIGWRVRPTKGFDFSFSPKAFSIQSNSGKNT